MYRIFQIIIIVVSAIIPLINLTASAADWAQRGALITTAILGSIITIVTAFMQMEKYFENWILYRTTLESLKREKLFFQNNVGDYSKLTEVDKGQLLVEKIEALLSTEHSKFFSLQQQTARQLQPQEAATAKQLQPQEAATAKQLQPQEAATAKQLQPQEAATAKQQQQ
jgi:hypothetical protein